MIGCGDVAEVKSGPAFYKAANSTLVAVMRRNGALAQEFAKRHDVPRWHDNADAIIEAEDIDAVYIATPTESHRGYALKCAAAGKAIYVEKPMAMNYAECCEMIGAARAHRVPLWVGFYRRLLPRFLRVKALVEEGAIGAVRLVTSEHCAPLTGPWAQPANGASARRVDPTVSGGGPVFDAACHTLDFLDFLFGPIEDIRGFADNQAGAYQAEDVATAGYRFASGVYGSGAWCYAADRVYEMNEIVGARGRIHFSTTRPVPIRLFRGDAVEEIPVADPPHVHQPLVESIIQELNGQGRCPSTGLSAARTAWVMDRLLGDFYPGRGRIGVDSARS